MGGSAANVFRFLPKPAEEKAVGDFVGPMTGRMGFRSGGGLNGGGGGKKPSKMKIH
jgi:hypothetical protein